MNTAPENPNLRQLLNAAEKLEPLLDRIVFVGGCVAGLLLTDPGTAPVRPTLDVDAIVEVTSYPQFVMLEERLRQLGFCESRVKISPVCRWTHADLIFDLMPTDPSILGFSNRWYGPALDHAQQIVLGKYHIRLVTASYFLATKLEAFHSRAKGDFHMSRDLEDIVALIDGRPELLTEIPAAEPGLRKYLNDEFKVLLSNRDFLEAVPGYLLPDAASQQRLGLILGRIKRFVFEG